MLLEENKLNGYLKYGLGEIVLVVIGILIALQINNWNIERKLDITRTQYLDALITELAEDTVQLNESIEWTVSDSRKLWELRDRMKKNDFNLDSIYSVAQFEFDGSIRGANFYNNSTLISLRSTGDLKLFPISIRDKLLRLIKAQENQMDITKSATEAYTRHLFEYGRFPLNQQIMFNKEVIAELWDTTSKAQFAMEFNRVLNLKLLLNGTNEYFRGITLTQTKELLTELSELQNQYK